MYLKILNLNSLLGLESQLRCFVLPFHNFNFVQIVVYFPVDEINLLEQLLLVVFELPDHFSEAFLAPILFK